MVIKPRTFTRTPKIKHLKKKNDWAENLTVDDRIDLAKVKLEKIIDIVCLAFKIRASNQLMRFPSQDSKPSSAAPMYNHLMEALMKFEALELMRLWDANKEDRNSIPTVWHLANTDAVKNELLRRAENTYGEDDPERERWVQRFHKRWDKAFQLVTDIQQDSNFNNLEDFRDYDVAHSLSTMKAKENSNQIYLATPFWGKTIACLDCLNSVIGQNSFDFDGSKKFAERIASSWWDKLKLRAVPFDFESSCFPNQVRV